MSLLASVLASEGSLRVVVFFGVLLVMAGWEVRAPRRPLRCSRWSRWPSNLALVGLNTVLLRVLLPWSAVEWAVHSQAAGWGLLPWLGLPQPSQWLIAVLLLDLVIYWQHVLFHRVPLLWRLHRMHHSDLDLDCTSGARFHTLEILLSMAIKFAAIAVLGVPATAVVVFEIILNALAMFNHSNVAIPVGIDTTLRRWIVTPDMHRVHHSVLPQETHSNFGFNLPWWDRWFGTYRSAPTAGQLGMTIGLPVFRSEAELRLDRLLTQPWRAAESGEGQPLRR